MRFSEKLNRYIADIGCTAKDLAQASGISTAAISRYRKGERIPDPDGVQLRMLAEGIAELSDGTLDSEAVHNDLAVCISGISVDYSTFLMNLGALLGALGVSNNELARVLNFDPSYISRILAGQRHPADTSAFVKGVARYVARRCNQDPAPEGVIDLVGENWGAISDEEERADAIAHWLTTNYAPLHSSVGGFLEKLGAFDLNDFIRSIKFDEMVVPTMPIQLPTTKTYTGVREMMDCELDFLKAAVLSKSSASIILYSDLPIEEMAADEDFRKKWMCGMALLLKKGLHLHMIHETHRPLPEMLLGLETWIPMYMTGQISPYYFENRQNDVFGHNMRVAGNVAMQGEAIAGYLGEGRYVLTKNRDEVRYYRRRAERMLEKALPLMRIVTSANPEVLEEFMQEAQGIEGDRHIMMGTLPISTMPPALLEQVLDRHGVGEKERVKIRKFAADQADDFITILDERDVVLVVSDFQPEEFDEHAPALELAGVFRETPLRYTADEYAEHLAALRALCDGKERCRLVLDERAPFRNMQVVVCAGHYAVVSKNASPAIHFIIEHPGMVSALEQFMIPHLS